MHTLELFLKLEGVARVVLVVAPEYEDRFADLKAQYPKLMFAPPGK